MQAEEFVNKLYEEAQKRKLEQFQINYSYNKNNSIKLLEDEISAVTNSENETVNFAVKLNGKIGKFSCDSLEEENISEIIDQAEETAQIINEDEESFFHDGSGEYKKVKKLQLMKELEQLDKVAFLKEMFLAAKAKDVRITKVVSLVFSQDESRVIMRNSLGLNVSETDKGAYAYISVKAEENGICKVAGEAVSFSKEEDFDAKRIGEKAAIKALEKLSEKEIDSKIMPIIFKNLRFPEMLRLLKNICSADAVQNERSKFVGQLGKKVASSVLTVIDDPHMDNGYGTASFDGEGYPTAYKEVIKNGILETYLHNLKTANKDKVRPTGNSSGNRGITVFNFYVKPGETSFEYLLKEAGDGVFIDDLMGISTGFNQISGDFSFGASGFVIENGKLGEHLKLVTISGNFYQMLKDIRMIGNDLEFHLNNIGSPSVLVDGLMVASK